MTHNGTSKVRLLAWVSPKILIREEETPENLFPQCNGDKHCDHKGNSQHVRVMLWSLDQELKNKKRKQVPMIAVSQSAAQDSFDFFEKA